MHAHPSSTELICVDPARVNDIWPRVAPLLQRATKRTGLSAFSEIEHNILNGDELLWVAWDGSTIEAAASTSLQQTDAGKVCVITACAGANMARWLPLIRGIEAYAKQEGCRCIRIFGRKGWLRVLQGYRQTHAVIDKRLSAE